MGEMAEKYFSAIFLSLNTKYKMFGAIKNLGKRIQKLDRNKLIGEIMATNSIQNQIIDLNQAQMFEKGIDAEGDSLGEYSKNSVEVFGKRPGHITLKDTGEFYDSMKVIKGSESVLIIGNTLKPDGADLSRQWPKALGLTKESVSEIIPEINELLNEKIKQKIFKA